MQDVKQRQMFKVKNIKDSLFLLNFEINLSEIAFARFDQTFVFIIAQFGCES